MSNMSFYVAEIQTVNERIRNLLAQVLQIPVGNVVDDLTMSNIEAWDSLKHMELIASLERTFGIEFNFDEIVAMRSVLEIKRVLRQRGVSD